MDSEGSIDIKPHRASREGATLRNTPSEGITITPAIFEQLYLSPQNKVAGDLRQTYANPTPMALAGFIMCATPVSMTFLGWQGAGGFFAAAHVGSYFGFGTILLFLGGIGEWILGNTFPATVFSTFGGFWLAFAITVVPDMGAYTTYSLTDNPADGMNNPQFYATFAFFFVALAILNSIYLIASTRTNVAFCSIFVLLVPCCSCFAAAYFAMADGDLARAGRLQEAGAGLMFTITLFGWYIFLSLILASVEFPFCLPMGDLSTIVPSYSKLHSARKANDQEAV